MRRAAFTIASLLGGCFADPESAACRDDAECAPGEACASGFCVAGDDGAPDARVRIQTRGDAATPRERDAGPRPPRDAARPAPAPPDAWLPPDMDVRDATPCERACTKLFDCTQVGGLCVALHEDERRDFLADCAPTCEGNPALRAIVEQQNDCEQLVNTLRGLSADFEEICRGG